MGKSRRLAQGISMTEQQDKFTFTKEFMRMFVETMEESSALAEERPIYRDIVSNVLNSLAGDCDTLGDLMKSIAEREESADVLDDSVLRRGIQ